MNQIIINLPNSENTVLQAVDIDDAVTQLQNLKCKPAQKQFISIHKFKGIVGSNGNNRTIESDWYNQ